MGMDTSPRKLQQNKWSNGKDQETVLKYMNII